MRRIPRGRKALFSCAAAWAMFASLSPARAQNEKPLQLVQYTPQAVDGTQTTLTTTLQLRNPNASPLKYVLTIGNSKSAITSKDVGWAAVFYDTSNKPVGPLLEGTANPNQLFAVRVDLSGLVEPGESTAELRSNDTAIGELKLAKDLGIPFRVALEGNPAEKPVVEFVKGSPLDLRLRNDDPVHYPVSWVMTIKGKSVSGMAQLGPNGSTQITVAPSDSWFSLYQSFFRSEGVDGTLVVGYQPAGATGAYPSKTIPISAKLDDYDPGYRDVIGMIVILLILAAGGIVSAYVNVDLVNRLKAISINKRVLQLARVIGEIGPQLSSQLRVSLWLERGRVQATLPDRILFTPETAGTLAQSDTDTGVLKTRVDLATQVSDTVKRQQTAIDVGRAAPTLMEQVSTNLAAAQELLRKSVLSSDELDKINSLIGRSVNILASLGKPDDDLEKEIAARLDVLKKRLTTEVLGSSVCVEIKKLAPIPFGLLDANAVSLTQSERDSNTRKLMVIADLIQIQKADAEILKNLARQDFNSLLMAELLLKELKDQVSPDDLKAALAANPPKVQITLDRDTVRVNTPILMKLEFDQWRYNHAAAKQRIECTWSFGHDNFTEKGWEVYHYFPESKPVTEAEQASEKKAYPVSVTFKDIDQVVIATPVPIVKAVSVSAPRPEGSSLAAVEVQRWAVGFFVALVGLFAGAKDKILTLDTAGAVFAIFLLGFGIDMAKNLLIPTK